MTITRHSAQSPPSSIKRLDPDATMLFGGYAIVGAFIALVPDLGIGAARLAVLLSFTQILFIIWYYRGNTFFLSRQLLLASVGYFAITVKALGPDNLFSEYEPSTQTLQIALVMF